MQNSVESHRIYLSIADINIKIIVNSKKSLSFIKRKYNDYIIESIATSYSIVIYENEKDNLWENNGNSYLINISSIQNEFAYFNDLFLQVFNHIINNSNGFIIHASTLYFKESGYIFMGDEGAGKSTIRKICKNVMSLGDDVAIIRSVNNNFYLFGSPFHQKTKRSYPKIKSVIKAVFFINQAKFTKIEKKDSFFTFEKLRKNVFLSMDNEKQNTLIKFFTDNTPILDLSFEKNNKFWKMISSSNFNFLLEVDYKKYLENINSGVNIDLSNYDFRPILADQSFVNQMKIINEISWDFEFNGLKTIEEIVNVVNENEGNSGPHTNIIKNYSNNFDLVPIICRKNNTFIEIIDGNHKVLVKSLKKSNNFKILYGN